MKITRCALNKLIGFCQRLLQCFQIEAESLINYLSLNLAHLHSESGTLSVPHL